MGTALRAALWVMQNQQGRTRCSEVSQRSLTRVDLLVGGTTKNLTPKNLSPKNCTHTKKNKAAGLCRPPEHGHQGARRQSTLAQGSTQLHPSWPCFSPCAGGDGGMLEMREAGILCTGSRL